MKNIIIFQLLIILTANLCAQTSGCISGDCINGYGTYVYRGVKYVGEFKNGKYNGQGTKTYPDGEIYVGEFKDNQRNGRGTCIFPDGEKFVGKFKDGLINGKGTYTYANGEKTVGNFYDGVFLE
jgi:hypothetical protein